MSAEQKPSQEKILATIKKHEKMIELAKKLNTFGKITEVIFGNVSEVVTPEEKILLCYYQTQVGQKYFENGTTAPQLYTCELYMLTDRNFLKFSFLQTAHSVVIKNVDHISELAIHNIFGSQYDIDETIGAEEKSFTPTQVKIAFEFCNSRNEKIDTWEVDTMDEQSMKMLLPQAKALSQYIGTSLSKIQL